MPARPPRSEEAASLSAEALAALLERRRRFRAFLARKVDAATADDVLQNAYAKALQKGGALRDGESVVAWFFRLLRNALADVARRRAAERKALAARALETNFEIAPKELLGQVCRCVDGLLETLRPEDAEVLRRVDRGDETPAAVAAATGIAPGTVRVRLHRARKTLKGLLETTCGACTRHGCLECSCAPSRGAAAAPRRIR
jgi:RNA polymerase sigma factor (sigma-70 family)